MNRFCRLGVAQWHPPAGRAGAHILRMQHVPGDIVFVRFFSGYSQSFPYEHLLHAKDDAIGTALVNLVEEWGREAANTSRLVEMRREAANAQATAGESTATMEPSRVRSPRSKHAAYREVRHPRWFAILNSQWKPQSNQNHQVSRRSLHLRVGGEHPGMSIGVVGFLNVTLSRLRAKGRR